MTVLVTLVAFTLLVSAYCSLSEATLYSTRVGTLEAAKAAGLRPALAQRLIDMKRNISQPIASILVLNTVANTAGATLVGALAAKHLGASEVPAFSLFFLLLVLFFGEIAPKTLGAVYWRRTWPFIVWPLTLTRYALYPVISITQAFADLLTRGRKAPHVTEDEILAMVRMGAREGQITDRESRLVHNIIGLENKPIKQIMTPRTVIFSLDANMTVQEAFKAVDGQGHTRIPIYEEDRENIVGYVMIHDLFSAQTLSQPGRTLKSIALPIAFVPATRDSLALLTSFLKKRRHIAVVVDEYGGVAGLVTLEDLIETLLGDEIVDETDLVVDFQEQARQLNTQRPTD
jgi:CBS domain containing-hemolysin-like protein